MPKTIFEVIEDCDVDAFRDMVTKNPVLLEEVDEDTDESVIEAIETLKDSIISTLNEGRKTHEPNSFYIKNKETRHKNISAILAIATGNSSDDETKRASDEDSDNSFEEVAKSQPKANHLFFEWVKKEQELEALKEEHNQRKQTNF